MERHFGILIYEKAQPMDVIGPWEVLATWKNILKAPIHLHLIAESAGSVPLDNGIVLNAPIDFHHCPPLDYLLVPGGVGRVAQTENPKLIDFIRKQAARCQLVLSVCTGMFLLAKAGLLAGKEAATYWRAIPELKASGIKVKEKRIVKSGKVWTSGGITSGIDLALAFIEELGGKEAAGQVQLLLEYFPIEKLYCSAETVNSLPPHQVPEYIRKLLY